MTLTPNFLPVGSIVEYNGKPRVITANDIHNCQADNNWFNNHYRPIPLTPKILTEWCGFEDAKRDMCFTFQLDADIAFRIYLANDIDGNEVWGCNNCDIYQKDSGNEFHQVCLNTCPDYLHELQLLFLGMKQVLPITIK